MGIVRWGPPEDLVLLLREQFGIEIFVETGTFEGATAAWAAKHFRRVLTVELSPQLFERAAVRYCDLGNIEFAQGDSATFLREIVDEIDQPAIYWLDAHWCGGPAAGGTPNSVCPLLGELGEINRSGHANCILIDDARYFLQPPDPAYDPAVWPNIWQVMRALHGGPHDRFSVVREDVIAAVPAQARKLLTDYCRSRPAADSPWPA